MTVPDTTTALAYDESGPKDDPAIWEETAGRYDRCHPDDTFADLVRRSSFAKEDRRLMEDWLASTSTLAYLTPNDHEALTITGSL